MICAAVLFFLGARLANANIEEAVGTIIRNVDRACYPGSHSAARLDHNPLIVALGNGGNQVQVSANAQMGNLIGRGRFRVMRRAMLGKESLGGCIGCAEALFNKFVRARSVSGLSCVGKFC